MSNAFGSDDWDKWDDRKKLKWLRFFRDRLLSDPDPKHPVTPRELEQLNDDIRALEKIVAAQMAALN